MSKIFINRWTDYDFSSKLCFEDKSTFRLCKIFQKFQDLEIPRCSLGLLCQIISELSLQKVSKKIIVSTKFKKETKKNQKSINPKKVSKTKHYKVGYGKSKNQIGVFIKVFQ